MISHRSFFGGLSLKDIVMIEQKKRITVSITPEMDKKLRQEAKDRGLSVSTVVTLALEEYWKSGK